ncbi:hypothetical protein K3495_g3636 [Podosphaera aphanis]|nr:hypothetical protein K3495_g3636 [Podosphaera aphanis]
MHGLSLTLPSPFGNKTTLPRSLSSSTLPDLSKSQHNDQTPARSLDELPRSASYTSLLIFDGGYKSDNEIELSTPITLLEPTTEPPQQTEQKNLGSREQKAYRKRQSIVSRPKSWIQRVRFSAERQTNDGQANDDLKVPLENLSTSNTTCENKTKTTSGSIGSFTRKKSRISRCPVRQNVAKSDNLSEDLKISSKAIVTQPSNPVIIATQPSVTPSELQPKSSKTTLQRIVCRPTSVFMNLTTFNSSNSSTSSLPRSSLDNRSTPRTSTDKVSSLPISLSTEKLSQVGSEGPLKRDELWSIFRALDNDFSKFQSKSWSLKTNVVRASLIPFLRNRSGNASVNNLRSEDLNRRVTVLNKWWTGLLEVLDGRQNQTVSGVDRPILLQACYEIMIRPEWRVSSSMASLERSPTRSTQRRLLLPKRSSASIKSAATSLFMVESFYQNIRNLFIHNLLTQLNFVVDKMSLRHAPASLVAFCGKATAYAFFFVPGVAEILVRIWKLQPSILRRVSDELGVPRRPNNIDEDEIMASFPAHLHCLGWSSIKSMTSFLRRTPKMSLSAEKISWYGPWVTRWCGRDSDLFFIFAKHYHILIEEFFTPGLSLAEKARAPGYLLVQAQTLTAIDATIHRQPVADPLPITFDDVLAGADASAAALPLPSKNSARFMAENRLIMLLRDFLCERPSESEKARMTFGEVFGKMMQAGAKKTSLFDHNACFVLCDFMEEALTIFVRFHQANDFIDWYFWLDVCKKMLESENTMTEIRLFAFMYGVWNIITADDRRKEVICLEWLLTEEIFEKYFNHWCPMIRAYYMRLLCWRLCRNDGESNNLDTKIFNTVSNRIKNNWAHYLYLKEQAEKTCSSPPSTTPCFPAPGRRLLIIRNDNQSSPSPLFLGFDGLDPSNSTRKATQISAYYRNSSLAKINKSEPQLKIDSTPDSCMTHNLEQYSSPKRRRSIIGRIFSSTFSSSNSSLSSDKSSESLRRSSSVVSLTPSTARQQKAESSQEITSGKPQETEKHSPLTRMKRPASKREPEDKDMACDLPTTHQSFSFKFSLEWAAHFESGSSSGFSPTASTGVSTPRMVSERKLSPPRLPAPAQALLGTKMPGLSREITAKDWGVSLRCDDPCSNAGERPLSSNGTTNTSLSGATEKTSMKSTPSSSPATSTTARTITTKYEENNSKTSIYKGRALAEWATIVGECNGFLERRRNEGVPNLKWVEVPTLGVEGFRR